MDFFQHQEKRRQNTTYLVLLLLFSVGAIVLFVDVSSYKILQLFGYQRSPYDPFRWNGNSRVYHFFSCLSLFVIAAGSLMRWAQLREGGRAIATLLRAREVSPETTKEDERTLLNIVEEMSIASGLAVPPVYLIDKESGINALAAGLEPSEAVIVVTQGAVQKLNRDELQAVVGHEFSHILNDDIYLNTRLVSLTAGILMLAKFGRFLVEIGVGRDRRERRWTLFGRNHSRRVGDVDIFVVLGAALFCIGYLGVLFSRLMKYAIARQRELLADAASVQFTRNPVGLVGALMKIGADGNSSVVHDLNSEELSHMFFSAAVHSFFDGLLSTHPSLEDRIRTVDPSGRMRGSLRAEQLRSSTASTSEKAALQSFLNHPAERVGQVRPEHLDYAKTFHQLMPDSVRKAAHSGLGAQALVFAILLGSNSEERKRKLDLLLETGSEDLGRKVEGLQKDIASMRTSDTLALLELSIPALKSLNPVSRSSFLWLVSKYNRVQSRRRLKDLTVEIILREQLKGRSARPKAIKYRSFRAVSGAVQNVLAALAISGSSNPTTVQNVFVCALKELGLAPPARYPIMELGSGDSFLDAVHQLRFLSPILKGKLIDACAECIRLDGRITHEEAEVLRSISLVLECPLPPLIQ